MHLKAINNINGTNGYITTERRRVILFTKRIVKCSFAVKEMDGNGDGGGVQNLVRGNRCNNAKS